MRDSLHQALRQLADLADQGRWVRSDNLHLTLQFLGDMPDDQLDVLRLILKQSAEFVAPFSLVVGPAGTFGRKNDILWIGLLPSADLDQLAGQLSSLLSDHHLRHESREFSAHITIGRNVQIDPDRLSAWKPPDLKIQVGAVSLMESRLVDGRRQYRAVFRQPIG